MNRYQLGDDVPISFQVRDANKLPTNPDAAPTLKTYNSAGTLIETILIPPQDRHNATGWFGHFLLLDDSYAIGDFSWRANWLCSAAAGVKAGVFHVLAGGNSGGTVESEEFVDHRGSTHLIKQLSTQTFPIVDNPRL